LGCALPQIAALPGSLQKGAALCERSSITPAELQHSSTLKAGFSILDTSGKDLVGGGFTVSDGQDMGLRHRALLTQQNYVLSHSGSAEGPSVSRGQGRPEDQPQPGGDSSLRAAFTHHLPHRVSQPTAATAAGRSLH